MRDIIRSNTCTAAWLQAINHLNSLEHKHDYNLILEITNPMKVLAADAKVKMELDHLLQKSKKHTVCTVINTIFPAMIYAKHGRAGMFKVYKDEVYPKLKDHPDTKWGTYFLRMTDRLGPDGKNVVSGRSKPAREGRMKTSHFEGSIVFCAAMVAHERDEPTQRELATFDINFGGQWLVQPADCA